ncbi:MAG: TonB-dependent receptor, partial [Bryobacterales bacterium]|nr:TonB-dependent receptor [Bryobacterales bacterium]
MVLILLVLGAMTGWGQTTTGVVFGTVRPAAAAATVSVEAQDQGRVRTTATQPDGSYRIAGLPPGRYTVQATASSHHTMRAEVTVDIDSHVQVDFELAVIGASSYTVDVRDTRKAIDPESPALGHTLDRDRIAQLPLNRRDFLQLAFLGPGVLPAVQDSELSSGGSFAMHALGAREEFNNFTLDGADNNDPYINRFVLQPSLESIGEFKVLTGNYSAEYGRSGGAQVNVVTRGGTNQWHGAAYEYLRNRALDARNYFDPARRPGYARNPFGGTLGGPVRRDRAFFFASYEALHERRGISRLAVVPSAAERAGDFAGRTVIDPFTRQPFPGGRIPAARIHPLATRVLGLFDRPAAPQLRDGSHNLVTRHDHHLSARDTVTVRYGWGSQNLLEPFAQDTTDVPGFGNYSDNTGHNVTAQHQRTWGAATVQTTRFAYQRSFRNSRSINHQTNVGQLWGVNWLNVPARAFGFPSIKVTGYSQVGDADSLPLERRTGVWQLHEALLLQRGAHNVRIGGEWRRIATDGYLDYFGRGSMTFSGALAGASVADVLLGLPTFGLQSQYDNRQSLRTSAYNAFAQDDWRIAPRVNLSLGVRYEFNSPPVDPADRMYIYDPARDALTQVGTGGFSRSGLRADRNNFAPRLGLAWTPRDGWVVRAGYGVYYDANMLVINSSLYFNPPLFTIRAFFPTATSLITLTDPFPRNG